MRFSNWELGTKQWFVLVEAYWLTAICVNRRSLKRREGGQFKLRIDSFCQRPVLTHTSESLLNFISSLQLKKWTLLLPTDQLIVDLVALPSRYRWPAQWPLEWFRASNLSPEDWQWDIHRLATKQGAQIGRLNRAEFLRLLAPLQNARLAPVNIACATQPFPSEQPLHYELGDACVVQHLASLHLALHGASSVFANNAFNFKRTPLARTSRHRFQGGLAAAIVISMCGSIWVYQRNSAPASQYSSLPANTEISKPSDTAKMLPITTALAADKNEPPNSCPEFDQQAMTINAIYREPATSTQESLTFIVVSVEQQLKKLYLRDYISADWQLTEVQSDRLIWSHTSSLCSVEHVMGES